MTRLIRTNDTCVNADGVLCEALIEIHKGCHNCTCPFYKTEKEFKVTETKARKRCEFLGIGFLPREKVLHDIKRSSDKQKRYNSRRSSHKAKGVIKYNSKDHVYVEYDSIESCSADTGIPVIKLELLIEKKEPYGGYRYIYT